MRTEHCNYLVLVALILHIQGCAVPAHSPSGNFPAQSSYHFTIPRTDPDLDHFIAWLPREQARTAAEAEAITHVALGDAREKTGASLCRGAWVMSGPAIARLGPYPATAPAALGGYAAWYYRISHEPGMTGCGDIDSGAVYQELGANLPTWITIRSAAVASGSPGGTLTRFSMLE